MKLKYDFENTSAVDTIIDETKSEYAHAELNDEDIERVMVSLRSKFRTIDRLQYTALGQCMKNV